MKVIFICGPFRAPTTWATELNVRRAEDLALRVWRVGAAALCPHTNTRYFDQELPDETFLEGACEMLKRCDAVMCARGWEHSDGATSEVALARERGMLVMPDSYEGWIELQKLVAQDCIRGDA